MTEVEKRIIEARDHVVDWKKWGPYLSERAWGTVREDYSPDGSAWDFFPHDHARSRAYRWNEDGLLGICDRAQHICFALALWNGKDPILKERLFGLTGQQGNHGEDVKEYYFYLDCTPCHTYMKALYKYPHTAYPYEQLVTVNAQRGREDPEFELLDTGVFAENRYFDVFVEYAKLDAEDILIQLTIVNHGPDATLDVLPTLWFRNIWSWGDNTPKPQISGTTPVTNGLCTLRATHADLGTRFLHGGAVDNVPEPLFTENETNGARLFPPHGQNTTHYVKDAFHNYLIEGRADAINADCLGTKAALRYHLNFTAGETKTLRLRLNPHETMTDALGPSFDAVLAQRKQEADAFYAKQLDSSLSADVHNVQRQAFAGLLWSKQFYNYAVEKWLDGDPGLPPPPPQRFLGRNHEWRHLYNSDVFSMPDTWEYPWYAAWDLAFHTIPLSLIDPAFAKRQLITLCREWYMHPNGQLPAYEWAFGDVNPPVHAWAAFRIYKIERRTTGVADRAFLEKIFHKLLLNFTWWVNRKDPNGLNVFQGGFLGMDNVGVFDRSAMLPQGGTLDQSDGTAWMGFYSLTMLSIALELARDNPVYEDMATKFLEHFLYIAGAMNNIAGEGIALWDEEDEFFYDVLRLPDGSAQRLKVRSLVGLIPLLAVDTLEPDTLTMFPAFRERLEWFLQYRPDLSGLISHWTEFGAGERRLLALVRGHRMKRLLRRLLDPAEFLSDNGIRSLSKVHLEHPYAIQLDGATYSVDYEPAESRIGLFGGNSNWRGPIWFPINYLIIEALQRFHHYYGDDFLVECPTGSGVMMNLWQVSQELSRRLTRLFVRDENGRRPVYGDLEPFQSDPRWGDNILFHEYFHGDTGAGLGASHQTGWTALVAKLIQQSGE
ncbi:MAG: Mannosyl oligosaccharide glucosidase [Chthonomonadaceae bacterium]|nr:Mannosyl oligosaccharide glucosidase [Chthonomonadaceae bacterium]